MMGNNILCMGRDQDRRSLSFSRFPIRYPILPITDYILYYIVYSYYNYYNNNYSIYHINYMAYNI